MKDAIPLTKLVINTSFRMKYRTKEGTKINQMESIEQNLEQRSYFERNMIEQRSLVM